MSCDEKKDVQPLSASSIEPPANDPREVRRRHEANRAAWNQGAVAYEEEIEETIAFLRAGKSNVHLIERALLGDLSEWCGTAIHLQCASGRDTLSLWLEGAKKVVGVDISDLHIENARRTAAALGAPAVFHRCDVLDTPAELDETADLVYTGRGALCWIHDLLAWAGVVRRLLKPGGRLSVLDDHPLVYLFDFDSVSLVPTGVDYFGHSEYSRGWSSSYLGDLGMDISRHEVKHERLWSLGAIFAAVSGAGLNVEHLGEHAERYYDSFPRLEPRLRDRIPHTFSLIARRPAV